MQCDESHSVIAAPSLAIMLEASQHDLVFELLMWHQDWRLSSFHFFSLLSLKRIVIFPWFKVVFLFYYYFKFDHHYFNYLFIFLFFCRILFSISNLNLNFFFIILLLFKNNPHYFNCYFFYFEFFVKLIIF